MTKRCKYGVGDRVQVRHALRDAMCGTVISVISLHGADSSGSWFNLRIEWDNGSSTIMSESQVRKAEGASA